MTRSGDSHVGRRSCDWRGTTAGRHFVTELSFAAAARVDGQVRDRCRRHATSICRWLPLPDAVLSASGVAMKLVMIGPGFRYVRGLAGSIRQRSPGSWQLRIYASPERSAVPGR